MGRAESSSHVVGALARKSSEVVCTNMGWKNHEPGSPFQCGLSRVSRSIAKHAFPLWDLFSAAAGIKKKKPLRSPCF